MDCGNSRNGGRETKKKGSDVPPLRTFVRSLPALACLSLDGFSTTCTMYMLLSSLSTISTLLLCMCVRAPCVCLSVHGCLFFLAQSF